MAVVSRLCFTRNIRVEQTYHRSEREQTDHQQSEDILRFIESPEHYAHLLLIPYRQAHNHGAR